MRRLFAFALSFSFLVIAAPSVQAEEPEFRGGSIIIGPVHRVGEGDATYSYTVKQNFSTEERFTKGIGGSVDPDSFETTTGFDLKSVPYSMTTFSGTRTISADRLDCSSPQDICRGCVGASFGWEKRTADIENDDIDNRSGSIRSRFSVLRGSALQPAAPAYSGDILFRVSQGKDFSVDLSEYIDYPFDYSCSLIGASFRNGLSENPTASTGSLKMVDGTCKLFWDIDEADDIEVGQQYNVQVRFKADQAVNNTNCTPETTVDLQIEIACPDSLLSSGDPSCFLCGDKNIEPAVSAIPGEIRTFRKRIRKLRRRLFRANRFGRLDSFLNATFRQSRRQYRRSFRYMRNLNKGHGELLSLSSNQSICQAASPEFCVSSSNLDAVGNIRTTLLSRANFEQNVFRAVRKHFEAFGKNSGLALRRANRWRDRAVQFIDAVEALNNEIPLSQDFCGIPNQ